MLISAAIKWHVHWRVNELDLKEFEPYNCDWLRIVRYHTVCHAAVMSKLTQGPEQGRSTSQDNRRSLKSTFALQQEKI